jgi:D-glycero-alpha-D-manno-heptose 1-phosphate guanylyltransferase
VLGDMTAVILAGGLGTRLRSVVADRPKIMALVAGRPFVTYLFDQVIAAGVRRAVLCTGYMAEEIRAELGGHFGPLQLSYSREMQPLGTGGALAQAAALFPAPNLLAMNGDSYCDADLKALMDWHLANAAVATLQLAEVPDTSRYGRVITDAAGRVLRFDEKAVASGPGQINAGIYCLSREALLGITPGQAASIERQVFPSLIGRGIYGRGGAGKFLDIGTPESYAQAESFFQASAADGKASR